MPRIRSHAALGAVLVAAALTGCQFTSVSDEPVELAEVRDAYVVTATTERPAVSGDTLKKGEGVRTRTGGTAALVVRGRRVVLGSETDVTVPDGATVDLGRGALLVDRREGPGVTVRVGDTTVDNVGEGAVRVERSFSVLVAGLSTGARVRTTTGPRLDLKELYQVSVAGRSLPRLGLPVQLRHDGWEKDVIPDVLTDDEHLNDLAQDLDRPGGQVVPTVYKVGAGTKASDLVLADAIGRAAAKDEQGRRTAGNHARSLRRDGGSWGVVAHLLGSSVVNVGTALSEVLRGVPLSSAEESPTSSPTTPGVVAGRTPQPGVTPSPSPTKPRPTKSPRPTNEPTESPTTESESPDPIGDLISAIPTPLVPPILAP